MTLAEATDMAARLNAKYPAGCTATVVRTLGWGDDTNDYDVLTRDYSDD